MYNNVSISVPYTAAGTASRGMDGWSSPVGGRIDIDYGFKITPDTSVATNGTDYTTYTLARYRAGSATTLATFTTNSSGGAALTQWTDSSMTAGAAATGTGLEVAAGDTFVVTKAESGSGKNGGALVKFRVIESRNGAG